jgi:ring-1,2-phenylacetyl-CoA epoxidase subunit PaaC
MAPEIQALLRLGDNALVLGYRVSEWCGHAPVLEEDIALANVALDLIGQATLWLELAANREGAGKTADDLAFLRDAWDFRNVLLVEQSNGDFGVTMMRQFLFDAWHKAALQSLSQNPDAEIAAIASKSLKEVTYHLERSCDIVIALGDGTEESHSRMQAALDRLWPYLGEMFIGDEIDAAIGFDPNSLQDTAMAQIRAVLSEATLIVPDSDFAHQGGKTGARHSEHLGHMLSTMQWMQRAYPGATW